MAVMSKPRSRDRHLQPKMTIRLGEPARSVLRKIAADEDRSLTVIITRALKMYAKESGVDWPDKQSK